VHGSFVSDLLPGSLLVGVGLPFGFVPVTIAALAGIASNEAGLASGMINPSQQIGGAIGVAIVTTVATTYTTHFVSGHPGATPLSGPALTHGFEVAFYVLAGLAGLGAILAAVMVESKPQLAEVEELPEVSLPAEAAA
jgi:sugar phosphate permease